MRATLPALTHVVGARPNFMKAGPVLAALAARGIDQRLVHTGQHYDERMSDVFFRQLGLPDPDASLGVGSGTHAAQTAALLVALEAELVATRPRLVVVYGDVNSTLAAALVASKLGIPIAHVEAGLRSHDRSMPEEVNREVADLLSDLLFATSSDALGHLAAMGVPAERIHLVGNPMIDTLLANEHRFDAAAARATHRLDGPYAVATLHRPGNVDDRAQARRLVTMLADVAERVPVVVPLHPRGRPALEAEGLRDGPSMRVVDPLDYVAFLSLVSGAAVVITDSGGVQEETTVLGVPCLTVRPNTERPVTITHGTNRLAAPDAVPGLVDEILRHGWAAPAGPPPLWDGRASERITAVLERWLDG